MAGLNTYKKLCSLSVYHRYHLDDGEDIFTHPDVNLEKQLETYNVHDFMQIEIFESHQRIFKGQKLFLKKTNTGFDIFVLARKKGPNSVKFVTARGVDKDQYIGITLKIKDPQFEIYSTVKPQDTTPLYFTNKRPNTEPNNFPHIDIADKTPAESYRSQSNTADDISALLNPNELQGLFGVVYLRMRGDNTVPVDGENRSMLKGNGDLVDTPPHYAIQLANRNTIWNYRDAQSGNLLHSSDPVQKPLVKRGIVVYNFDGKDRPSAIPDRLLFEKDNNGNIIKTFSEIYI
ncbi:MAG: hypothetical protein ABJM06_06255 [Gilvibacter sp.]